MDTNGDSTDSDDKEDKAPEPEPTPPPEQQEQEVVEEEPVFEEVPERKGPTFREIQQQREYEALRQEIDRIINREEALKAEIEQKKEALEGRGSLSNFFWGPDWELIRITEEKVKELKELQAKLDQLSAEVSFEDNWPLVEQANSTVKPVVEEYRAVTDPYKEKFSLLGWLFKMFYFKEEA
jgi:hypothetical protein